MADDPPELTARLHEMRFKVYPNPMRDDGVFVAEDKPILPYVLEERRRQRHPAVPQGAVAISSQLPPEFARRIVACLNHCRGIPTERLDDRAPADGSTPVANDLEAILAFLEGSYADSFAPAELAEMIRKGAHRD